jgi:hypothetical protein
VQMSQRTRPTADDDVTFIAAVEPADRCCMGEGVVTSLLLYTSFKAVFGSGPQQPSLGGL